MSLGALRLSQPLQYFNRLRLERKPYSQALSRGRLYPVYPDKDQGSQAKEIANERISVDLLQREGLADSYGV